MKETRSCKFKKRLRMEVLIVQSNMLLTKCTSVVTVAEGSSDINVKCDASDGSTSITVIHVFRPSASDATLKGFQFLTGSLLPDFHRLETKYVLQIGPYLSNITVLASPMNSASKLIVRGIGPDGQVKLEGNETHIEFEVTSADGSSRQVYQISVQKKKCTPRLPLSKEINLEAKDICSICCSVLFLPRQKATASTCKHEFCSVCLELFMKTKNIPETNQALILCPLCLHESGTWTLDSNQVEEKILSTFKHFCPFQPFGCTHPVMEASVIHQHVSTCPAAPLWRECKVCYQSKIDSIGKTFDGESHKESCTYLCSICQKKVPNSAKSFHEEIVCIAKHQPMSKSEIPVMSTWEEALIDKKAFPPTVEACAEQAQNLVNKYLPTLAQAFKSSSETFGAAPTQPHTDLLEKASKLYATAIAINAETKKVKGGALDESIHISLGLVMEELSLCQALFPPPAAKERNVKANDNAEASASFMSDEVDGLLMGLGVPKNASDATKIKAMEAEFHRLTVAGLSDQATEVQGLHQWKIQQVNSTSAQAYWTSGGGKGQSMQIRGSGTLLNALEKFEHAVMINPESSEAQYHLGRINASLENWEKAQIHLERALVNKPVLKNASVLWSASILSQSKPSQLLIQPAIEILEDALFNFQTDLWLAFRSHIASQSVPQIPTMKMSEDIFRWTNPLLITTYFALSRGYLAAGIPAKAKDPILSVLHLLPDTLRLIPRKSSLWHKLALSICEARRKLVQALPLSQPTEEMLDGCNVGSLLPFAIWVTTSGTQSEAKLSAENLTTLETVAQSLLFRNPASQMALTSLGKAQLQQVDGNAQFLKNERKLQDAIESFEAAASLETGNANGLIKVHDQDWFVSMKAETDAWIMAAKPKEAKASVVKGVTKKGAPAPPVKGASAAKTISTKSTDVSAKTTADRVTAKPLLKFPVGLKKTELSSSIQPKPQGKSSIKKSPSTSTSSPNNGSLTKIAASKNATPKVSSSSLSKKVLLDAAHKPGNEPLYDTHIGLARAISRKLGFLEDTGGSKSPELLVLLDSITMHYKTAIGIDLSGHDAYIELGALLERKVNIRAAAELYATFPFPDLGDRDPGQDDLYLYTELGRCFMKEKRYKEPLLMTCLIAEGRAMGMPNLAKYVEALDAAGESKLLMAIYAGVSKKSIDHPDLLPFFKSRYWT
ncbi:hypothetical protein BC830DRAFT_630115 [Chytriomyces sp. MP71]|nr:hypothetical protein BC830DRAFT_630115 [Chytriomyces sp. MP71]